MDWPDSSSSARPGRGTLAGSSVLLFPPEIAAAVEMRESINGMEIWDPIRKKWLVAVPEEWVRQHCIVYLEALGFPKSNMTTEAGI